MKLKHQIRTLFEKQILENDTRKSLDCVQLVLKFHRHDQQNLASDGFNSIQLSIRKKRKQKKYKILKKSVNDLRDGFLYLFSSCKIKFELENGKLKSELEVKGFGVVTPFLGTHKPFIPPKLEEVLEEYEDAQVRRKVGLLAGGTTNKTTEY